jgi:hypothetical protein
VWAASTERLKLALLARLTWCRPLRFATSLDSEFASLLFGPNQPFVDVNAWSHEISEWMNDPFVSNIVPPWQTLSTLSPATCNNLLQTGDPVDPLGPNSLPVMVNGFTYHPQTEAWLQWFSGESPSSAIGGTYSFPDTTPLTSPSTGCQ